MTIAPITAFFISSLVFGSLYFSQIPARSKSDTDKDCRDYIHMNECISESGCVCELILPGSVSLLVVKLWDLVIKKYTFQFLSYFTEKSQNSVDNRFPR